MKRTDIGVGPLLCSNDLSLQVYPYKDFCAIAGGGYHWTTYPKTRGVLRSVESLKMVQ
jgi:hypothetical protein